MAATTTALVCPDCEQGKHPNCDGGSWDNEADAPAICPCWVKGHQ